MAEAWRLGLRAQSVGIVSCSLMLFLARIGIATLGAVFGLTTCLSAQVREDPEDALNYFIGGCASGIVLGARNHSHIVGSSACVALGLVAAFTKIGKREGWKIA